MAAAAHGNEACTVENGRPVSCGSWSAYLLYNFAHQPVQLNVAVIFLHSSFLIVVVRRGINEFGKKQLEI